MMSKHPDGALGIINVKSHSIKTMKLIAEAVRAGLRHAPAEKIVSGPA